MNTIVVNADRPLGTINRHIYGHFSEHLGHCIYGGYWVGRDSNIPNVRGIRTDVVEALRRIRVPNLRWPGGCFADEYHWMDGIGPQEKRPSMINTHWGGVSETNAFGTHEFMDLCDQLDCEPYICGNVGSGSVREMSQWVEYLTSDAVSPMADLRRTNGRREPWSVKFWGVGNESWGCGGHMRPEYYADEYRRYATYCRNYGDNRLFRIACGPNVDDYHWTEVMMERARNQLDGISLHNYTIPGTWADKGPATGFDENDWYGTMVHALRMDELVRRHSTIMDRYDPDRRVALAVDEWGTWYDVEPGTNPGFLYQQNSMRDAVVAAIHLNIFNSHSARVRIANIAQTVNVLQAMILSSEEQMLLTPSYHVFEMFAVHQESALLPSHVVIESVSATNRFGADLEVPHLQASSSRAADGAIHVSLCNLTPSKPAGVEIQINGAPVSSVTGRCLAGGMDDHNTFESPDKVRPFELKDVVLEAAGAGSKSGASRGARIRMTLPAAGVAVLVIR